MSRRKSSNTKVVHVIDGIPPVIIREREELHQNEQQLQQRADEIDDVQNQHHHHHHQPPGKKSVSKSKRKSRGGERGTKEEEEEVDDDGNDNNNNNKNGEFEEETDDDMRTLGERVRALEVSVNGGVATTSEKKTTKNDDKDATAAPSFVPPKADSLATLLAQALAADDVQLLERCFSVHDKRVIETTVGRLSGPLAMKLLSVCLDNMKDKPESRGRVGQVVPSDVGETRWVCQRLAERAENVGAFTIAN